MLHFLWLRTGSDHVRMGSDHLRARLDHVRVESDPVRIESERVRAGLDLMRSAPGRVGTALGQTRALLDQPRTRYDQMYFGVERRRLEVSPPGVIVLNNLSPLRKRSRITAAPFESVLQPKSPSKLSRHRKHRSTCESDTRPLPVAVNR